MRFSNLKYYKITNTIIAFEHKVYIVIYKLDSIQSCDYTKSSKSYGQHKELQIPILTKQLKHIKKTVHIQIEHDR